MDEMASVLDFWFPADAGKDLVTHQRYMTWRFRGGADAEIIERFSALTERAAAGDCDDWALASPRGRLALIVTLDQFPRSVWRGSPRAYECDPKALELARAGYASGDYDALETVWEKTFFMLPYVHCEGPDHLERCDLLIELAQKVLAEAPPHLRPVYEFSAQQPVEARKIIAAFGRHPHRNDVLGRDSTPEERAYIERGDFPHARATGWQT